MEETKKGFLRRALAWLCGEAWPATAKEAKPEQGAPKQTEGPGGGVGTVVLKVVGAIASAVGAVGAVTVVGAAVFWVRFNEVGLPATQAVSVVSRQEQLVQGSQDVIVFVLIALAAVLLVFFADPKGRILRITVFGLGLLAALAIAYVLLTRLGLGSKLLLIALAVALAVGSGVVGRRTGEYFWPLAASVFLSTLIFSAACGLLIVQQQKFVQAVAILRGPGDRGLTGFYVAAGDDTIYLGRTGTIPSGGGEASGLFEVHRGEELTYAVGPLESEEDAQKRGYSLLAQLIEDRRLNPPSAAPAPGGGGASTETPATPAPRAEVGAEVLESFVKPPIVHDEVEAGPLCLERFSELGAGGTAGPWWTSCGEFGERDTVTEIKERLALPARFQAVYDVRTKITLPAGARLFFLEGRAAAQCEHDADSRCGHRYEGGGKQYYVLEPLSAVAQAVGKPEISCSTARQDRRPDWHPCAG